MPKRVINDDYVWRGEHFLADRDDAGKALDTVVDVPKDFPAHIGQPYETGPSSASAGSRARGVSSTEATAGGTGARETTAYAEMDKAELVEQAQARGLSVIGTGVNSGILKSDLIDALAAADEAEASRAESSANETMSD